ncbi:hypothetical protein C8R47DRAFT_1215650 [Mycena vitilis]|nr:hypothetical protein C8R47DRAFT_1215650 [Mycena vitilis]
MDAQTTKYGLFVYLLFFLIFVTTNCQHVAQQPRVFRSTAHTPVAGTPHTLRVHGITLWADDLRMMHHNRVTSGPGQPGGLENEYPSYGGAGGGHGGGASYDRAPFSSLQIKYEPARRMTALTSVVNVDDFCTDYGFDTAQRKAAHSFVKVGVSAHTGRTVLKLLRRCSSEDRATTLFLRLLRVEHENQNLRQQVQDLDTHLEAIGEFCSQTWKPSRQQVVQTKSLLRHYIIRPVTSYNSLVPIVETYIYDHAKRLHLELYKQDPTVKAVVSEFLTAENNASVFASSKEKVALSSFSMKIIKGYHLPTVPTTAPQDIMACLALMRHVARPLLSKATSRGGDTEFWTSLEGALDKLFDTNGNERDSEKWRQWEVEIIDQDNQSYLRQGTESSTRTREEIDAATGLDPAATRDDVDNDEPRDYQAAGMINCDNAGNNNTGMTEICRGLTEIGISLTSKAIGSGE